METASDEDRAEAAQRHEEAIRRAEATRFEMNPLAIGVAILGAALIVVGLFLPANENPGFSTIEQNTLIQQGAVVITVLVFGAFFAISLARAYQRRRPPSGWALLFPISVFISAARLLKGATLYPVINGHVDTGMRGMHAAAGTGVYLVLAGCVIAAVGIVAIRTYRGRKMQQCPACAELVLSEAKVCRYCGHRFDEGLAGS